MKQVVTPLRVWATRLPIERGEREDVSRTLVLYHRDTKSREYSVTAEKNGCTQAEIQRTQSQRDESLSFVILRDL
jgi:hypothetical protein